MALKTLDNLFLHFLKDIYYAEKQIIRTLPKMTAKAEAPELRKAFESHLKETEGQVKRLEEVFDIYGKTARGETCEAINGIIEEGKGIMEEANDPDALNAGLIASAQAVEHYEIARYGTLVAWARQLGHEDCAKLLEKTLDEEYAADKKLSALAENSLNQKAA
jgi:ferritin-like metal-binding protein YciE